MKVVHACFENEEQRILAQILIDGVSNYLDFITGCGFDFKYIQKELDIIKKVFNKLDFEFLIDLVIEEEN